MPFPAILLLLLLLGPAWQVEACPEACRCSRANYRVDCSNRGLRAVPPGLPGWTRWLDLSQNEITIVEELPMRNLRSVRELRLSANTISSIQDGAFQAMPRLLALYLDQNKFTYFTRGVLKDLRNLRLLRLDANNLSHLQSDLLRRHLPRLVTLRLDDNPVRCDCKTLMMRPLLRQAEGQRHVMCASPDHLERRSIADLLPSDFRPACHQPPNPPAHYKPPTIASPPSSQERTPGAVVVLRCTATGQPSPSVAWFKDNVLITGVDGRNEPSIDGAVLRLSELHRADAGVYTCVAVNSLGRVSARADVSVVTASTPLIRKKPVDQEVREGADAVFTCVASGKPKPQIRWIKKHIFSQMLKSDGKKYTVEHGSLTIRNVSKDDIKSLYICTASSEYGSVQAGAQIRILSDLPITPPPMPKSASLKRRSEKRSDSTAKKRNQNSFFNKIIEKARMEVSRAINATLKRLQDRNLRRTAVDVATLFRQPNEEAIRLSRAAETYERAVEQIELILRRTNLNISEGAGGGLGTKLLSDDQLSIIARLSGCQRQSQENIDCSFQMCFHNRFRAIDGICNNLRHPRRGAALSPFFRLIPPQYENGVNEPLGWNLNRLYSGYPKPSARLVSLKLLSAPSVSRSDEFSSMLMQWGQFLDHDLDFTPVDASNRRFSDGVTCNETCVNESPCFPIGVPPEDKRIRRRPCIGFARSSATCGSGATSLLLGQAHFREQINQITSYIDASNVYGSHRLEAAELRDLEYDDGKMREGMPTVNKTRLLPFNIRAPVDCQIDASQLHVPCFLAGDHRANENLGLISMHTLWLREHNRLVTRLRIYNPHWSGDRLYHEGRKIIGAMMQHITYSSWLPKILGKKGMMRLGRRYRGYDINVDASISNVFATAAFRFGHTLINPILYRLNQTFGEIKAGHLPLHKAFFAPHKIVEDGGIDPVLRGLMAAGTKKVTPSQPLNTELTENLFKLAHQVALDLGALNIQRGRDHGLSGYVGWRRHCNLSVPTDFDGLRWEIPDPHIREKMRQIYGHPDNIDLFAGGVLEEPMPGALIGPTFACIIIDQFQRLRSGDRFWYENPAFFTPAQLAQLRRASLSRIICDNSDNIQRVSQDAFLRPRYIEDYIDCRRIPEMELGPWKECRSTDDLSNVNTPFEGNQPRRRRRRSVDADVHTRRQIGGLQEKVRQLEAQMAVLAKQMENVAIKSLKP